MGERIRAFDWANHPLGSPEKWPDALHMALRLCLNSTFPSAIYWGRDLHLLYNDAWSPIPAERHPDALGKRGADVWPDIWSVVGPQFEGVLDTGQGETRYPDMDALSRQALGEVVPLRALPDWLAGRPWAGAASQARTDGFAQLGWTVSLAGLAEGRIDAVREDPPRVTVRVRLERPPS